MQGRDMLERGAELSELARAWERAHAGFGTLVMVEAAAGKGKSALLGAARRDARAAGMRTLTARGGELERGFAFGAIRQLFETVVGSAGASATGRLLAGAAAPAAWVVAPNGDGRAPPAPEAHVAALHGIYWLATNLAVRTPLLLAVDDLHWVDSSSVRALVYLARRIRDLPIVLLVALRPDEPGTPVELLDQLRSEPDAASLALQPLSAPSVATLVRAAVPGADDELCDACFAATSGNPFYLRELLRTLGRERSAACLAEVARDARLPVVADRVVRRVARLSPDAVALARAMAVLDRGRLAVAAAVAGLSEAAAASAARTMERIEVLASEDPFAFVHPIVRRSVYDTLSVTERDDAHRAAATRLRSAGASADAVAAHLAACRPAGSVQVAAALCDAADEAMARAAPEAAIGWLRRALEEDAAEPPRAHLLHRLGGVEAFGRDPHAIGHLQRARELTTEPVERVRLSLELATMLNAAGCWEEGVAAISQGVDELGGRDPEMAVELEAQRAVMRAFDPRLVAAFDRDRARLERLAAGECWGARALSVVLASVAALRGEPPQAVRPLAERGLEGGRLLTERGAGDWAAAHALTALVLSEAEERAAAVIDELEAQARRAGVLMGAITAVGYRGWLRARRGDLAGAEAQLRPPLDLAVQNAMPVLYTTGFMMLQDAMRERPSLDDVAAVIESIEVDSVFLTTTGGGMLLEARGHVRLVRGAREQAVEDLRACGATYEALGVGPPWSHWRSALALALPPQDHAEALRLVDDELRRSTATGMARPRGITLRAAGLLRGDDEGVLMLRDSVAALEGAPARLELARSLVELGAALRRRGRRTGAREPLARGMDLAHRCGADRLASRAAEELRASGARPRRPVRTGVDALTPSERRAASLVARGQSNSEVAQELYVSLKTVETHLSHVYAKLGLSGPRARRELAALLGDEAAGRRDAVRLPAAG